MAFIFPAPGVAGVEATLRLALVGGATYLNIPAMQDVTFNNSNDLFTWTQLDEGSKLQVPTTATNSLDMNIVLDQTVFFGTNPSGTSPAELGVFGLSKNKTQIYFELYLGDTSAGTAGKTVSGIGYISGLAPTVSADAPVWVSPITIAVTGDYGVA